jgi:hypothetical protein
MEKKRAMPTSWNSVSLRSDGSTGLVHWHTGYFGLISYAGFTYWLLVMNEILLISLISNLNPLKKSQRETYLNATCNFGTVNLRDLSYFISTVVFCPSEQNSLDIVHFYFESHRKISRQKSLNATCNCETVNFIDLSYLHIHNGVLPRTRGIVVKISILSLNRAEKS